MSLYQKSRLTVEGPSSTYKHIHIASQPNTNNSSNISNIYSFHRHLRITNNREKMISHSFLPVLKWGELDLEPLIELSMSMFTLFHANHDLQCISIPALMLHQASSR